MKSRNLFVYVKSIFVVLIAITIAITFSTKADEDVLKDAVWDLYITGGVSGSLTSNRSDEFSVNLSSIGNNGDFSDGYNWNGQISNTIKTGFKSQHEYTIKGTITSDKDRTIFLKVEGPGYYGIIEEYITLKANEEYKLNKTVIPMTTYDQGKVIFAVGYSQKDDPSIMNSSNRIEVTNFSIQDKGIDPQKLTYKHFEDTTVLEGSIYKDVYTYKEVNTTFLQPLYIPRYQKTQDGSKMAIYFALYGVPKNITINDVEKSSNILIQGAGIWIPLSLLENEYNKIEVSYDNPSIENGILYIKNANITTMKEEAIAEIDKYNNLAVSDEVKNIIKIYKDKVVNAKNEKEVENELTEFKKEIKLQLDKENGIAEINKSLKSTSSDEIKNIIDQYKNKINNANTKETIDQLVKEAKEKIELQESKENAIKKLESLINNQDSSKIKEIVEKAKEDIKNASTIEEVEKIVKNKEREISNQKEKENVKSNTIITNPLTYDNIIIYFITLLLSMIVFMYTILKLKKNK